MSELFEAILSLETREEVEHFLRDLCTLAELEAMAHRWAVARLLDRGLPYLEIATRTGASTTTVTRVAHWLRHGEGGYRLALDRLQERDDDRLTIAVPVKGRLREPSVSLLEDAGLRPRGAGRPRARVPVPERAGRRAARARGRHPGVRAGRRRRLRDHRARPRPRARRRDVEELLAARLRLVPARRRGARGVGLRADRGSRGRDGRDRLPAPDARADAGARSSSSRSPARSRSRRGSGSPTGSSTSSRPGTRCARTACARSARSSRPRRC